MPSSEPLGVRMRLRRVLSKVGDLADRIWGANELWTHGLARDCYRCGPGNLCRNPDRQRLCLLGFGGRPPCLDGCSHPEYQDPFQDVDDANHRAASCCDRGGLRRNPNNNRLRLLDFGSRLSRRSWQYQLFFEMKVDRWFAYLAPRLEAELDQAADGFGP